VSLDLELLIVDGDSPVRPYAHTVLALERSGIANVIRDEIQPKHGKKFEDGVYSFYSDKSQETGVSTYGKVTETPFGKPLRWVPAKVLKPLLEHADVERFAANRAAWRYICALPDETRIGLYFH
jgi:hypothetical protein